SGGPSWPPLSIPIQPARHSAFYSTRNPQSVYVNRPHRMGGADSKPPAGLLSRCSCFLSFTLSYILPYTHVSLRWLLAGLLGGAGWPGPYRLRPGHRAEWRGRG